MVKVNKTNLNKSIDLVNQEKYEIQPSLLSSEAIEAAAAKLRKQASIRTRHPGVTATAVLTTTSSEEAKNAPQQDPRHVDLKPKEAYGNMRVKFLVDYAKATTELRESINHGYESIYDRFTKLLNDSPFKDLLIEWSQQQNAVPNNRHDSILTTNLSLANNDDVAKKPKGTKRKKKQKSTIAESSCEGATNELNDTQLLTKLAAQTAQMLTNSTENLSISSSSLSSKKALDRTYQVQVKHTEVLVEKSTSQASATVKLTAETCLKRTASKPQTKTRLESVDEDADSTLRSDNESASNQTQPITVKKKKVKNTAPSESSSMAELSRMPNPLASSSIMAAPVTKTTSHPQPPKTPKNSANSVQTAVNESGKVKKLVEVMEARIKATPGGSNTATATTTTTGSTTSGTMSLRSGTSSLSAAATVAAKRLQYSTSGRAAAVAAAAAAAIQQQAASSAAKLRSSIDKRKQRVSGSKAESKRASMRKVNALFKGLNETGIDQVDNASSKAATYEPRIAGVAPLGDDSTLSNASSSSGVGGGGKKPRDLLLGSAHLIQQNYKLSSAQKPLVPSSAVNTSATASARKTTSGFNKFLERNTPCKLTQTEIDEKRKELAAKEKKEQDRVIENKKQMMEKVEIAKKRREERMKKINDMRVQKEEEEKRKREEAEAEARLKQRELEEARKRMQEEKRQREEAERQYQVQQQIKAQQQQLQLQQQQKVLTASINSTNSSTTSTSVQKVTITQQATFIKSTAPPAVAIKSEPGVYDPTSTFKQPLPPSTNKPHQPTIENKPPVWNQNQTQQQQQKTQTMTSSKTTPSKPILQQQNQQQYHHYQNNPPIKQQQQQPTSNSSANANNRRAYENYGVEDLHSGDETDDDEEPAKPIPLWAQDQNLIRQTVAQNKNFVNFTKIFRATSHAEVDLTSIFKIKRPKFTERSSSANWTTPPVWSTGINGDESFWVLHK